MEPAPTISEAAASLLRARLGGKCGPRLPQACRPTTIEQAYAIQREVGKSLGAIGGWKVGRSGPAEVPLCAPLFASDMHRSGSVLQLSRFGGGLIEMEIAFRIQHALPDRRDRFATEEVAASIELLPLIEILSSRFENFMELPAVENLADCMANGAVVYGESVPLWRRLPMDAWSLELHVDGALVCSFDDLRPPFDPLELVVWQLNELADRGLTSAIGDIITTGTLIWPIAAGRSVLARWRDVGEVSFRLE